MSYAIKNLKTEIDDAAAAFGLAPSLEARFAYKALGCETVGLSYQRLAPGFRVPFGHRHAQQEEIYVVVTGSGRIKVDDEIVEVGPWDAVRVAKETMRAIEAGPEGLELLAVGAPRPADSSDTEMVQDWWID